MPLRLLIEETTNPLIVLENREGRIVRLLNANDPKLRPEYHAFDRNLLRRQRHPLDREKIYKRVNDTNIFREMDR